MQTSKSYLVAGVIGFCAASISLAAPINPPSGTTTNQFSALPPRWADAQAAARERDAVRAKIAELNGAANAEKSAKPAKPAAKEKIEKTPPAPPAPAAASPAMEKPPVKSEKAETKPLAKPDQASAAAERSRQQKEQKLDKAAPPGFTPIPAPPLPISATKQARLAELLGKYKSDEISSEEYQKERARILSEP